MGAEQEEFNRAVELPYEITIPIGDWSGDGHRLHGDFSFRSSHPVEALRAAYLKSVEKTGFSLDDTNGQVRLFSGLNENSLSAEMLIRLEELGFDAGQLPDPEQVAPKELAHMVMWFISLSLPDLKHEPVRKTYLNGYWNPDLNVSIGNGVYYIY